MRKNSFIVALTAILLLFNFSGIAQNEQFKMRSLACNLSQPWEIKFGPDGYLWVTEAHSYKISRVDPVSGNVEILLDLSAKKNFPDFGIAEEWPQGGLQGFAFHPNFTENPYFYVGYVHQFDSCKSGDNGCFFKTKLVRYNYNLSTKVFSNELVIIDTIPGSSDHNGGRLVIGPVSAGMGYLFYSVGDMGAGHLGNASREHHGQQLESYEGKILRFNLLQDSDTSGASWIPNDNPFNTALKQSAVWTLGHRNPQGLVFSPEGILYESEHGPYSDDEINIITRGTNYGFPLIMGYTDGNYDGSKAGAGSGLPMVTSELANRTTISALYPYSDPIASLFPASKAEVTTMFNYDINNNPPFPNYYLQYPTSAPSGIDFYNSNAIPGWSNSLLITNLKLGSVYRIKLTDDDLAMSGDTISYFKGLGRFRDLAISPDGTKIYVSTDSEGSLKGAPGEAVVPPNKGCILEFSLQTTAFQDAVLKENVIVYPNPTNEGSTVLSLKLQDYAQVSVDLYSITGQKLRTLLAPDRIKSIDRRLDLTSFGPGSYFIKVQIGSETVVKKLVQL